MNAQLAIDATIARPPFSGVQNAVHTEAEAIRKLCHIKTPSFTRTVAGRILWQQLRLPSLLKSSGASVLFAPGYTCPLHTDIPVILQVHDIIALEHPEYCSHLNVLHIKTLLPASIRKASRIVASTSHVRSRIISRFPDAADKISVIPLGVDYSRFSANDAFPNKFGRPYILFVGNIEPKKGIEVLLDAYCKIADRVEECLVIAGRTAWKSSRIVSRIKELEQGGKVIMAGRVSDDELPSLYRHASAFVFPSLEEGFGMPVLEAMAAGTPVIHSDHPAVSEAAGGAGIPFACGNAASLANEICTLLQSNELRHNSAIRGREHASKCSWNLYAEAIIRLFHDIVKQPN